MLIIETFLEGRDPIPEKCEDGFIITEDYAVVIDGASSKSNMDFEGKTSARYVMELIKDRIKHLSKDLSAYEFINDISISLKNNYKKNGWVRLFENNPSFRPTASMVVYSKFMRELWFFGDCKALLVSNNGLELQIDNDKYIDEVTSSARKLFLEAELRNGKTLEELLENDTGREYINSMLIFQQLFQNSGGNSVFDYSAVDGWEFNKKEIKKVSIDESIEYIVLATDGYKVLKGTLEETEYILKEQLKNDPLAINELMGFKTLKSGMNSFDDRAYIKIRI